MSAVNSFETSLLALLFNNTDIANIGDASGLQGAATVGVFYFALFTANPGEAGSIGDEATYGGYARVSLDRDSEAFIVSGGEVTNGEEILFPVCTSGSETITHWALCTGSSGANILIYGALASPLLMAAQVQPRIQAGYLGITLD